MIMEQRATSIKMRHVDLLQNHWTYPTQSPPIEMLHYNNSSKTWTKTAASTFQKQIWQYSSRNKWREQTRKRPLQSKKKEKHWVWIVTNMEINTKNWKKKFHSKAFTLSSPTSISTLSFLITQLLAQLQTLSTTLRCCLIWMKVSLPSKAERLQKKTSWSYWGEKL